MEKQIIKNIITESSLSGNGCLNRTDAAHTRGGLCDFFCFVRINEKKSLILQFIRQNIYSG